MTESLSNDVDCSSLLSRLARFHAFNLDIRLLI